MVEKSFIENTLADLVQINSVNPDLDSNGCGEQEIGMYINRLLKSFQLKSEIHSLGPERINVVGILEGTGEGKSLMLNAHMDTVGVQGMQNPFSGAVKDAKLYGRGAYDMKGSIAAMLAVAKAIKEQNIKFAGDLVLAFVADEEFESKGTQQLIREYKTNGAIVAEPTDLNICLAHRGFAVYEITTKGNTAHGGNNHIGIDANSKMGLLLTELDALSKKLSRKKGHPLLGQASVHVPLIKGGQSLFIYSDECTINVERRTLPGESGKDILSELESIIEKISRRDDNFKATIKPLIWREPYEISENKPVVDSLRQSAVSVLGRQPSYIGHSWWEDSALIGKNGTETVIMGPKGGGIHEAVEWVDIQSVVDLSEIFLKTAIIYCSENQ